MVNRLFGLAYGRRLRNLLNARSGVGPDGPEHDLIPVIARFCVRSRIARCEVRYNREKVPVVEFGYNWDHQRAPFSPSGGVLEVIELPEHVAR